MILRTKERVPQVSISESRLKWSNWATSYFLDKIKAYFKIETDISEKKKA